MTFDIEESIHGLRIVAKGDGLTTASLHGPEIDAQVARLKAELDAVARKMKAKLKRPRKSLFDDGRSVADREGR